MAGILERATKASELTAQATYLIFGSPATGKTTAALNLVKDSSKVLWLSFNNLNTLIAANPKNVDILPITAWREANDVVRELKTANYDAVVIDGLSILMSLAVDAISDKPSQSDWLVASKNFRDLLRMLTNSAPLFVCTLDLAPDEQGNIGFALNRYAANIMLPIFGAKWLTEAKGKFDDKQVLSAVYRVVTNATLALEAIRVKIQNKGN